MHDFAPVQVTPHPPQLPLLLRLVSQPLAAFPSQFPKPALHEAIAHEPLAQVAVALVREHATPQPPQLPSELSAVSQPFAGIPSQSAKPARQAYEHEDPEHETEELGLAGQAAPQPPQWLTLLVVLTSQPSAPLLLQSPKPPLHENPQAELLQNELALARPGHALAHAPQWLALLVVLVSQPLVALPSQLPKPAPHDATWHEPEAHVALPLLTLHVRPHIPQWLLLLSAVSQPFAGIASQLPKPAVQLERVHAPAVHAAAPLANEHALPHIPQCAVESREVSQPLAALPSQSPKPALHVNLQAELEHETVAFARAGQALPQEPQCEALLVVLTQDIPQSVSPAPQPLTQTRMELQLGVPPEQALPQALQLAAVPSGVSQPFAVLPSQFAKPALQLAMAQAPAVHVLLALGSEHVRPHAPQLLSLVRVSTHVMPQRVSAGAQPVPHAPPLQMGVAPEHALAHMPQLALVSRALSQPLALLPSQLPKPIAQAYWHCPAALQVEGMLGRGAHDPHVPPQPSSPHTRPAQSGVHPGGTNTSGIDASGPLASGALPASLLASLLASIAAAASIVASVPVASGPASGNTNCASKSNGIGVAVVGSHWPPSPQDRPRAAH